jgi:hypothetical protein
MKINLFRTPQNFIQKGHKLCLCLFVVFGLHIIEDDFSICSAGIIKPVLPPARDAVADFQSLFIEPVEIHHFMLKVKEPVWLNGFNTFEERFNVRDSELLTLQNSITPKTKPKTDPKADETNKKWYEKQFHHWRFYSVMF